MNNLKEMQKEEAVKRLKMLDIYEDAVKLFVESGSVMISERPLGALYELNNNQKEIVLNFEEEYNGLVYLLTHTITEFGELYEIFYVSEHQEEWGLDREDINNWSPLVYVFNVDDEYSSEFGRIGVTPRFGGLIRTA